MKWLTIVQYPDSKILLPILDGMADNCRLITGERGIFSYGEDAYVVDKYWMITATLASEFCYDTQLTIDDDELVELGFLDDLEVIVDDY